MNQFSTVTEWNKTVLEQLERKLPWLLIEARNFQTGYLNEGASLNESIELASQALANEMTLAEVLSVADAAPSLFVATDEPIRFASADESLRYFVSQLISNCLFQERENVALQRIERLGFKADYFESRGDLSASIDAQLEAYREYSRIVSG